MKLHSACAVFGIVSLLSACNPPAVSPDAGTASDAFLSDAPIEDAPVTADAFTPSRSYGMLFVVGIEDRLINPSIERAASRALPLLRSRSQRLERDREG